MLNKKINLEKLNSQIKINTKGEIYRNEYQYKSEVNKIAKFLNQHRKYKFLLVAGPSSAGKTTTSKLLIKDLLKFGIVAKLISLDDFFMERSETPKLLNGDLDYENVNAVDWKLFDKCMSELLQKKSTNLPTYNFITGTKSINDYATTLNENEVFIIEGLHTLNPIINNFIPEKLVLKIYLKPMSEYYYLDVPLFSNDDIRFFRRMLRDNKHRGSSPIETKKMWELVNDGERKYITPYIKDANFKINTSHAYEICIYKNAILSLLNEHKLDDVDWFMAIIKKLEKVCSINYNYLPNNSLLQEFIEGYK